MAKKAAKNNNDSQQAASGTSAAMKPAVSRSKKHVKAQAVAAAVEGFVQSLVHPDAGKVHVDSSALEGNALEGNVLESNALDTKAVDTNVKSAPVQPQVASQPVMAAETPAVAPTPQVAPPVAAPITHERISVLAYEFFLERRGQNGSPADDWFRAEQALKSGRAS